jgi:hypothetical protein
MFSVQQWAEPVLEWELEGVEIRLYASLDGYLLAWGDYVGNTSLKSFEYLSEAVAFLAVILIDTETLGTPPKGMAEIVTLITQRNN